MKAVVLSQFGGPENFEVREIPRPRAGRGEVVVKVAASSVNPIDYRLRATGLTIPAIAPKMPAILHGDMAGTIVEVGEGSRGYRVGDEVYGMIGGIKNYPGALREFVNVHTNLIAHKPKSISLHEAAVLPLVSITAWMALIDRAKLKKNQTILVYAGTGGVGHVALQLAKSVGARVYTTISSPKKADIAIDLGADVAFNYKTMSTEEYVQQFTKGQGFDVVFDTVGGDNLTTALRAAKTNGTVVTINSRAQVDLTPFHPKGLTLHVVFMLIPFFQEPHTLKQFSSILQKVAKLVDQNQLKPLIDPTHFTFSTVGNAHRYLEQGNATGKVLLINDL